MAGLHVSTSGQTIEEELALRVKGLVLMQGSWLLWEKAMNMNVLACINECGFVIL